MRSIYPVFVLMIVLTKSAQCQQTAEDWFNKGLALGNLSKYEDAINANDEAIRLDPNVTVAWYNKGSALNNQGKHDEAVKAYEEAIRLDTKLAQGWYGKGLALKPLGEIAEANAAFAQGQRAGI